MRLIWHRAMDPRAPFHSKWIRRTCDPRLLWSQSMPDFSYESTITAAISSESVHNTLPIPRQFASNEHLSVHSGRKWQIRRVTGLFLCSPFVFCWVFFGKRPLAIAAMNAELGDVGRYESLTTVNWFWPLFIGWYLHFVTIVIRSHVVNLEWEAR